MLLIPFPMNLRLTWLAGRHHAEAWWLMEPYNIDPHHSGNNGQLGAIRCTGQCTA